VSGFFDPPPPPPPEPSDHRPFEWVSPPDNELGVVVPLRVALARTDAFALTLATATVYSNGFVLGLTLRLRTAPEIGPRGHPPTHLSFHSQGEDDLRLGLEFSDGTKATTAHRLPFGAQPSPPMLTSGGSQSAGRRSDGELWAWPLPPPGALTFVWEWRAERIPLTRRESNAQPILEAARRVEQLWPDERPLPTGPWTHVSG
jgi:hypothetical protein